MWNGKIRKTPRKMHMYHPPNFFFYFWYPIFILLPRDTQFVFWPAWPCQVAPRKKLKKIPTYGSHPDVSLLVLYSVLLRYYFVLLGQPEILPEILHLCYPDRSHGYMNHTVVSTSVNWSFARVGVSRNRLRPQMLHRFLVHHCRSWKTSRRGFVIAFQECLSSCAWQTLLCVKANEVMGLFRKHSWHRPTAVVGSCSPGEHGYRSLWEQLWRVDQSCACKSGGMGKP